MGTKNNPGKYDCHANAHPDEPLFTLLGRDPLGAGMVRMWAHLRAARFDEARGVFNTLVAVSVSRPVGKADKINEALTCAASMDKWLAEDLTSHRPVQPFIAQEDEGGGP